MNFNFNSAPVREVNEKQLPLSIKDKYLVKQIILQAKDSKTVFNMNENVHTQQLDDTGQPQETKQLGAPVTSQIRVNSLRSFSTLPIENSDLQMPKKEKEFLNRSKQEADKHRSTKLVSILTSA